jgi:hypothetical protein
MNDEAPRTQKLVDEHSAQKEVERIASRDRITHRHTKTKLISSERNLDKSSIQQKERI